MRESPAFLVSLFSPWCPLFGAVLPRHASSRSPARTPAGGGLRRARLVSWRREYIAVLK